MGVVGRRFGVLALVMLVVSAAQAQNKVPSERMLESLVKAALMSFNDANVTGNYAVFHARLSKPFRDQFSPERLKDTFREFSDKHIDIGVASAYAPAYTVPAAIDGDGKLQVRGFFPTEPARVNFELDFIPSDGEWKLIRIHVKLGAPP